MRLLNLLPLAVTACAHPAPPEAPVEADAPRAAPDAAWTVDGAPVSKAAFDARAAALVGPQEHWSCAETTNGGETSWIQRDTRGVRWRVTMVSDTEAGDSGRIERE
jgi:hypothetical protein